MASQNHNCQPVIPALWVTVALTILMATPLVYAEPESNLYLPQQPSRYNPLQNSADQKKNTSSLAEFNRHLDNESLLRSAEQLRSTSMSADQRALNHQWLQQDESDDQVQLGGRVLSTLMKMGFKTYWEGNRIELDDGDNAMPNSQGNGKFTEDIDYKIRMSGDKIKFSFEYDF